MSFCCFSTRRAIASNLVKLDLSGKHFKSFFATLGRLKGHRFCCSVSRVQRENRGLTTNVPPSVVRYAVKISKMSSFPFDKMSWDKETGSVRFTNDDGGPIDGPGHSGRSLPSCQSRPGKMDWTDWEPYHIRKKSLNL